MADRFDEERVAAISANISSVIDAASLGNATWDEVPATLSKAFPGSFGGLYNMNFPESRLNFLSFQNMDPAFVKSYSEHFAYVNPWAAYWTSIRSDTVAASEDVAPARSFAKTEFYNDWLRPQKDVEAAVGMKIVGEQSEAIHTILHFPVTLSGVYDRAAVEIMKRIRGSLMRSVHLARLMRSGVEDTLAEAALVERSRCAALVVDGDRSIRDANQHALQHFSEGQSIQVRNHRCMLSDASADARFGRALSQLSKGLPTDETRIVYRKGADAWQVVMAAIPPSPSTGGLLLLLPPRRMVLVLIMALAVGRPVPNHFSDLASAFGMTPAEVRFCGELFLGKSIAEIADQIGISVETARSHMKAILQKTGTSRQSQLMLLLSTLQ